MRPDLGDLLPKSGQNADFLKTLIEVKVSVIFKIWLHRKVAASSIYNNPFSEYKEVAYLLRNRHLSLRVRRSGPSPTDLLFFVFLTSFRYVWQRFVHSFFLLFVPYLIKVCVKENCLQICILCVPYLVKLCMTNIFAQICSFVCALPHWDVCNRGFCTYYLFCLCHTSSR